MRGNVFAVTVEVVALGVQRRPTGTPTLAVLLAERPEPAFAGTVGLPGDFVGPGEDLADAARRVLAERAVTPGHLVPLGAYAAPGRDPRGRVLTAVHLAFLAAVPAGARLVRGLAGLGMDHDRILADALDRARELVADTTAATALCPDPFTVTDLRHAYEAVWDAPIDPRNFSRKVTTAPGFLERTGATSGTAGGRPAQLYRPGPATRLRPVFT